MAIFVTSSGHNQIVPFHDLFEILVQFSCLNGETRDTNDVGLASLDNLDETLNIFTLRDKSIRISKAEIGELAIFNHSVVFLHKHPANCISICCTTTIGKSQYPWSGAECFADRFEGSNVELLTTVSSASIRNPFFTASFYRFSNASAYNLLKFVHGHIKNILSKVVPCI